MNKSLYHDDRGLSLVELLVAVAILALVAVPLGRAFVTSARIAARSEAIGDATEAARNVAEAISATGTGELYSIMEQGRTLSGWRVSDAASYQDGEAPASSPMSRADPIYTFTLQDISYATRSYDALVTLRADETQNAKPLPQFTPMDAVFDQKSQPQDPDEAANTYFADSAAALYGTVGDVKRTIALTLYADEKSVSADISYDYSCTVTFTNNKPAQTLSLSRSYSVVGESELGDDGKAPAVYIMYKPFDAQDHFTISCASDVTVPVFLAAQSAASLPAGYGISVTGSTGSANIYANARITSGTANLYASESVDRLYTVTIELYAPGEVGTGEVIYTLDATKMD